MPQNPSGPRRLPGRTTPASSPLSPPAEATPESPPQPNQPLPGDLRSERPARLQPQSPAPLNPFLEPKSESRQYLPPHPLLLLLANPDGSLKPEFADYQDALALESPDLVPAWWPRESPESQEPLSPANRARDFHLNLEALLSPPDSKASGSAPQMPPNSTPQRVLRSLLQLRSEMPLGTAPTLD